MFFVGYLGLTYLPKVDDCMKLEDILCAVYSCSRCLDSLLKQATLAREFILRRSSLDSSLVENRSGVLFACIFMYRLLLCEGIVL